MIALSYFAEKIRELSKQTLDSHVHTKNATHLSEHSPSCVHIFNGAFIALRLNNYNHVVFNRLLQHIHELFVFSWQISHTVSCNNYSARIGEDHFDCS